VLFGLAIVGHAVADETLQPVALADLCVTNGEVKATAGGRLSVETPSSRAVLRSLTDPVSEIDFRYLGPTAGEKPLASGELRRQIGLKLRARDSCNLIYAMWRIEPDQQIVVSIKENPGMSRHAECDAHGYTNLKPTLAADPPPIVVGEEHRLRAELSQSRLTVIADGTVVWSGDLGPKSQELDGPVGMRSDNAHFEFVYLGGERTGTGGTCARSPED
jgi:hypothetical protein